MREEKPEGKTVTTGPIKEQFAYVVFVYKFWSTEKCCSVNTNQTKGQEQHCIILVPESEQSQQTTGVKTP